MERSHTETPILTPHVRSLGVHFSWTLLGSAVYGACQWGMVIVLAKLTSPADLGRFTLAFAVTAPVVMFFSFQLRTLQATDAADQYEFADYLGMRLLTNLLALGTIGCILLVIDFPFETKLVIALIGAAKLVEATSDVLFGWFQKIERMDLIGKSMAAKGVASVLLFGVSVFLTGSLVVGCAHLLLAWGLVLFFFDLPRSRATWKRASSPGRDDEGSTAPFAPRFHRATLESLLALAWPLAIATLMLSLFSNVPAYVIERTVGVYELGLFGSMFYLILLGQKVVAAAATAVLPRLSVLRSRGETMMYRRLMGLVLFLIAAGGLGAVLVALTAGRAVLSFLYGAEYAQYPGLFAVILLAGTCQLLGHFLWMTMTAARHIRVQIPLTFGYLVILTLGCLVLVPAFGINGAGYGLLLGSVAMLAGNAVVNRMGVRRTEV